MTWFRLVPRRTFPNLSANAPCVGYPSVLTLWSSRGGSCGQVDRQFAYAYTLLGHEYVLTEELDRAMACFRNALHVNPRHYNGWWVSTRTHARTSARATTTAGEWAHVRTHACQPTPLQRLVSGRTHARTHVSSRHYNASGEWAHVRMHACQLAPLQRLVSEHTFARTHVSSRHYNGWWVSTRNACTHVSSRHYNGWWVSTRSHARMSARATTTAGEWAHVRMHACQLAPLQRLVSEHTYACTHVSSRHYNGWWVSTRSHARMSARATTTAGEWPHALHALHVNLRHYNGWWAHARTHVNPRHYNASGEWAHALHVSPRHYNGWWVTARMHTGRETLIKLSMNLRLSLIYIIYVLVVLTSVRMCL